MLGDVGNIRGVKRTAFKSAIFKVTFIKPVSGRKPGAGFCHNSRAAMQAKGSEGPWRNIGKFYFLPIEFALGLWYDEPED